MKILLTIAGFDPSSGAGVTADLAVFAAHGYFGISAITALTAQSTQGVRRVEPVAAEMLRETLTCLADDFELAGIKIGMLGTLENVLTVVDFLGKRQDIPVVLDPVLQSSSGHRLLEAAGVEALRERLLPRVTWVTPNRSEWAALDPVPPGVSAVITGGDGDANDLILQGEAENWLYGTRIESRSTHGTGCAFSSALLCALAAGVSPVEAARRAKDYVAEAIRQAPPLGRGIGPMALGWPLRRSL